MMDRRQAKTRTAIVQAFDQLVAEKPAEKITVIEISARADIGKSTFYTHFETKEHLIMDLCAHFFEHLKESENSELFPDLAQMLQHLLWHLTDEKSTILKLIKDENPICHQYFIDYLKGIFAHYCKPNERVSPAFALNHIVESFIAALRFYIHHPDSGTVQTLVQDFIYCNDALLLKKLP